jgi:hypothetical protein
MVNRNISLIIILALLVGAGAGIYYYTQEVRPKGLVSATEVKELQMTEDGERVESGQIYATLVVDRRDRLEFSIRPDDKQLEEDRDKNIPPGSEIEFEEGIDVMLRPAGAPYVHGPVRERGFVYDDKGYPTSEDRVWKYFSVAPHGWTARHVPYQVKAIETGTGEVLVPWTSYISGHTEWDDGQSIDLPAGITLSSLGELLNGVTEPSSEYAYIWNVKNGSIESHFVDEDLLDRRFSSNPPGPRRTDTLFDKIEAADDDNPDVTWDYNTRNDDYFKIGVTLIAPGNDSYNSARIEEINEDGSVEIYWEADKGFRDVDTTVEFDVSGTRGFEPDKVRITSRSSDARDEYDLPMVKDITNGTFSFTFLEPTEYIWGQERAQGVLEFQFYGATDTWEEFVSQTRINEMSSLLEPASRIIKSKGEVEGVPADVEIWDRNPILHSETVERAHYDTYDSSTGEVAVYKLDQGGSRAFVRIKAPISHFETVVNKPPYGIPEIVSVSDVSIIGGDQQYLKATVKNVGYTEDTIMPSLTLPSGVSVVSSAGEISIPAGESRTFEWVISSEKVDQEETVDGTIQFEAKTSGETSGTSTFSVTKEPGEPPTRTGSLSVYVQDGEGNPIQGATVEMSGIEYTTDRNGRVIYEEVSLGTKKVTVTADEFGTKSKNVDIEEGSNSVTFNMAKADRSWIIYVVIGIVAAIAVIAVYFILTRYQGG